MLVPAAEAAFGRLTLGDLDLDTVTSRLLEPTFLIALALLLTLLLTLLLVAAAPGTTLSRLAPSGSAAILASSSCSCCSALTKAALSLLVCSCLSAFFTLLVTHCSQITLSSLPET